MFVFLLCSRCALNTCRVNLNAQCQWRPRPCVFGLLLAWWFVPFSPSGIPGSPSRDGSYLILCPSHFALQMTKSVFAKTDMRKSLKAWGSWNLSGFFLDTGHCRGMIFISIRPPQARPRHVSICRTTFLCHWATSGLWEGIKQPRMKMNELCRTN